MAKIMPKQSLIDTLPEGCIAWDGFDSCAIGLAERCGSGPLVIYDFDAMVQLRVDRDGLSLDDAAEYIEFNIIGAYVGENTPYIMTERLNVDDETDIAGADNQAQARGGEQHQEPGADPSGES